MFAEADETRFIIQEEDSISMYEMAMVEEEDDAKNSSDDENAEGVAKKKKDPHLQVNFIWRKDGIIKEAENLGKMHNPSHSFFKEDLHSSVSILDKLEKEKAKGKSDVKINEHFFFMDNYHIYKIDKVTKSIHVFQDQNISGLFFSDNNYLYTLSHKRPEKNISSGFRLYDVWNCITTGEDLSYQLSRVQVGCQNLIDFSKNN